MKDILGHIFTSLRHGLGETRIVLLLLHAIKIRLSGLRSPNPKMKNFSLTSILISVSCLAQVIFGMNSNSKLDFAQACYGIPLPDLVPSSDNRTVPWGTPSINNGSSTCCESLDEVRAGINAIDTQLLELLSQRSLLTKPLLFEISDSCEHLGLHLCVKLRVSRPCTILSTSPREIRKS